MLKELVQTESPSAAERNCGGCGASIRDRSVNKGKFHAPFDVRLNKGVFSLHFADFIYWPRIDRGTELA